MYIYIYIYIYIWSCSCSAKLLGWLLSGALLQMHYKQMDKTNAKKAPFYFPHCDNFNRTATWIFYLDTTEEGVLQDSRASFTCTPPRVPCRECHACCCSQYGDA